MNDTSKFGDPIKTLRKEFPGNHLVTASRLWLQVSDIMSREVVTICPDQTIASAAKIMDENNISCVVVVDNTKVAGIITETDFFKKTDVGKNDFNKVRVAEIMSSPVESICPDFSILEASKIAIDKHVKKLPVLNRDGQLIGIVTQTDLNLSLTSYGMWWNVSDIMKSNVAGIEHKATVAEAAKIMTSHNISCIVVLNADQVMGIFTERDLVRKVIALQKDPACTKIEDVMSSPVISVPPDCSVLIANRIMKKMNIRRLLCLNDKRLWGIVTQTDIFLAMRNKLQPGKSIQVLIINDNQEDAKILQRYLSPCRGGTVKSEYALNLPHALEKLNCRHFDLIFLDNRLGGDDTVPDVFENLRKENIDIPVVIIADQSDTQSAAELMKMGAFDYITKEKLTPDLIEKIICTTAGQYTLKTVQRHSEQILRQSEERYRHLVNAITDYIYTVRFENGRPVGTTHSSACVAVTGYGPHDFAIDPHLWINMVHPENREAVLKQISHCLSGEYPAPLEHRIIRKNGTIRWVKSTLVCNYDSQGNILFYDGLLQDITERRCLQEKLDRKQKNLEVIFDMAPIGMMLVDEDMIVKRVNKVIKQMVGVDYAQIINRRVGDAIMCINSIFDGKGCGNSWGCLTCQLRKTVESVLDSEKSIQGVEFQFTLKVGDKEITPWLCISAEPTIIDDCRHVVVTIADITNHKQAEETLEQLNKQLEASVEHANLLAQEATVADLAKSQFLANMSHEIRTPMNAIMGFSQVLSEENLADEQKHYVDIIQESAENLLLLINDILDFSKIEAGKLDLEIVDSSLEHLSAVIELLMRPLAMEKGLEFGILYHGELPAKIRTDPVRLRQCLINLVNNAIKFTESGHVHVNICMEEFDAKSYIRFDIKDTGIGIPAEKQELIFEKFIQVDADSTRKYEGTGLGLAITKQLAELLGGKLSLTSKFGKGSVFSLMIPANVDVKFQPITAANNLTSKLEQGPDILEEDKFTGRVLVAEDSPTNQMLINLLLQRLGLEVTLVEDGKEAVREGLSQSFDLIFTDIQMPNMNGYDATKTLRKNGIITPIVALTAHAMKGDKEKCISAGCDDYLTKPIKRKKLVQLIRKYLPSKSKTPNESIDPIKSEIDQLSQFCSSEKSTDEPVCELADVQSKENIISWSSIMETCGDEGTVEEIVKIFLDDAPQSVELIVGAIKTKNFKNLKLYAHRLKGSAGHVAAKQLLEMAYRLECAGDEKDIETAASLLDDVKDEFGQVMAFLSRADWIEKAKQHENRQTIKEAVV